MRVTWGIFLPPRVSELGDLPSPSWEWSGGSSLTWALILRSWFTSSSLIVPGRVSTHKSVYKEDNGASTEHWAPSATVNQRVRTVTARSYFPGFLMELCDPCFQLFFFFFLPCTITNPSFKSPPLASFQGTENFGGLSPLSAANNKGFFTNDPCVAFLCDLFLEQHHDPRRNWYSNTIILKSKICWLTQYFLDYFNAVIDEPCPIIETVTEYWSK